MTMAAAPSSVSTASSTALVPSHTALQHQVLNLALARLRGCLEAPSGRAQSFCEELGIGHYDLVKAVCRQQLWEGQGDHLDKPQADVVAPKSREDIAAVPSDGLIALLAHDLSAAFFSQEVLHGERALGDARDKLEALWDKLIELTEERDKTFLHVHLTPEKLNLVTALARALEQQAREEDGYVPFASAKIDLLRDEQRCRKAAAASSPGGDVDLSRRSTVRDVQPPPEATWGSPVGGASPEAAVIGRSSLIRPPSAGKAGAQSPPTSRLPTPKAGRTPRSLPTTPTGARHQRDRDDIASPTLPPPQRRRLHSPPQGQSTCERCGGGVGDRSEGFGRVGLAGPVVAERGVGERRGFRAFFGEQGAAAADDERNELDRLKKEIEGLRGQRDALARSLSFARDQYSDALGDKPVQIERLSREVDTLRHTSETLRGELVEEKKRRVEETSRLESRVAATREAADEEAARREKEAERAKTMVDPDHAAASEVLEKRVLALEARLKSMASRNGSLQGRLDAALGEMEEMLQANNALRAEADARRCSEQAHRTQEANLLENISSERDGLANELRDARTHVSSLQEDALSLRQVERATAADADVLRALLAEARRDVVGAKATAAAAAAAAAVAAEATATAEASAAAAVQDVETHKAARAAAEEEAQAESEAAASAAAAAVEAAKEANEIFEEALAAAKATAEREIAAASQIANQTMDARDVELRKLEGDVARLIDERDRMAEAIQERVVEAERKLDISVQQVAVAEAATLGAAQEAENHKAAKVAAEKEAHVAREAAAAASAAAGKANDIFEEALAATKSTAEQEMAVASQRASQAMGMREVELRKLGEDMALLIDERDRMAEAMQKRAIETENMLKDYAQQVTVAEAAAAGAAREVGKHKAARAAAEEAQEACEAAATASAEATVVAAEEANERFEEGLAATKAMGEREMAAASQRASQAMDVREVELRKLTENLTTLVGERDGLAKAMKERAIEAERTLEFSRQQADTAAEERDTWMARSEEWENKAASLADLHKTAEEDAAAARQDLEGARARARQELAETNEALALEIRLREEEAATARGREEALENELEVTQALVLTLESEASTAGRSAETTGARATTDMAYMRDALGKAQARLGKMETERDAALRSLLAVAEGRGASRRPGFQERREEGDPCEREDSDGSTEGSWGNDGSGSGRYGSGSATANIASNNARGDATEAFGGDGKGRGSDPAGEVTIDGAPSVEEDSKPAAGGAPYSFFNERAGGIDGAARGGGSTGDEHACRVCGMPDPSSHKLFECRLSLGRARADVAEARARAVEAAERAAAAAEDAMASRRERKDLAATLEGSIREVEATQVESRRVSELAMEREAGANHDAELIGVRLAEAEAQVMETKAELSRERETKASVPTDDITAELETIQAALDDCRADLNERTRQLYAVQDQAEVYSQAAASRAAAQASASAKSLAKAMRETDTAREAGEELLRRAKGEAEAIREEEGITAATALAETVAAAEKARARDAMDLVAVAREKDVLREKCVWLEARLSEMQAAKLASDALFRRMKDATDDRDETVRTLERDAACQGEKVESLLAETHQALEKRLQEMEDAVAAAEAELDSERRRAASQEEAAAYELEQTIAAHQAELRRAQEAGQAKAWVTESRVVERGEEAAVVAAATAAASARRELAQAVEAVSLREGEIATLQARLRLTEEEVEAARRKALLEGQAALLSDVAAANKKAAEARAEAAALRQRCDQQELAIGEMASSREEEADACRVARASLAKERLALAKAQAHVRELKTEFGGLSATTTTRFFQQEGTEGESSDIVRPDGRGRTNGRSDNSPLTSSTGDSRNESTVARGRTGARETKERDRTRGVVFALEESLNAAREEAERLKKRVSWLRDDLHGSEQRADEMEAAAASARAAVDTVSAAMKATAAEAEIATARRHEAEQKALAVKRREEERNAAFEAEVSQVTSALREAQEGATVARGEVSRLRGALRESDRRTAVLQEILAVSNSNLLTADAERARALIELVGWQDRGADGRGGRVYRPSNPAPEEGVRAVVGSGGVADVSNERGLPPPPPPPPPDSEEDQSVPTASTSILPIDTHHELTTLRHRLAVSQAHHRELVRASDNAIVACNQRCDARVRTVAAAGTLAAACCRRRGIATGRESAVEAAARLALVKRCFRALREEALSRSRDRSVRRQERIQRWVADAVERAGEEIILKNKRRSGGGDMIKVGSPPESALA